MKKEAGVLFLIVLAFFGLAYLLIVFFVCSGCYGFYCKEVEAFGMFYEESMRGHIFSGFLALGGFLLSLKTFIIVTMKEHVYDHPAYKKKHESAVKAGAKGNVYGPLKELSDILFYAILASLIAALLQMSIGLYSTWWVAIICLFSSFYALSLLVYSLLLIKRNLNYLFNDLA